MMSIDELLNKIKAVKSIHSVEILYRILGNSKINSNPTQIDEAFQVADRLYNSEHKALAIEIYSQLITLGHKHILGTIRLADNALVKGDAAACIELLDPIREKLDPWGLCVLASGEALSEEYDLAASTFQYICSIRPNIEYFWTRWYEYVIMKSRKDDHWSNFIVFLKNLRGDLISAFEFRWLIANQKYDEAARLFDIQPEVRPSVSAWDVRELLYKYRPGIFDDIVSKIEDFCLVAFADQPMIYKPIIDRALSARLYERASTILRRSAELGLMEIDLELRLKRFELSLHTRNFEDSKTYFLSISPISQISNSSMSSIYLYLGEMKRWDEIVDDFILRAIGGFRDFTAINTIIRACRRSGRTQEVAQKILSLPTNQMAGNLYNIMMVLISDLIYCGNRPFPREHRVELSRLLLNDAPNIYRQRILVEESIRDFYSYDEHSSRRRIAVYLCANKGYLCGAMVTLFSLLLNNPNFAKRIDCFIVAESRDEDLVVRAFEPIGEAFDVSINVVVEDLIIDESVHLKSEYGLMTGGVSLAKAAYYRIYFARYLRQHHKYEYALYLDSDVVINPGIEDIFSPEISETALFARMEVDRAEVRSAIAALKLEPGKYFNSGILLFNLLHPSVDKCLDIAIHAAEHRSSELIFQDQCALNAGFAGQFRALDVRFNYFISPDYDQLNFEEVYFAVIIHFLDRPKPWDAMYVKNLGLLWLQHWQKVSILLTEELAQELYSAAIR